MHMQAECTPDQLIVQHFTPFDAQHPRCDYGQVYARMVEQNFRASTSNLITIFILTPPMQFHIAQMDVLIIFIIMPLTDLPVLGQLLATIFGILQSFLFIPWNFLDVLLLYYQHNTANSVDQRY